MGLWELISNLRLRRTDGFESDGEGDSYVVFRRLGINDEYQVDEIGDGVDTDALNLKTLNISHNRVSGSIPSNIGNFGSLQSLDLSFNNFSGEIPESVSSLLNLQFLRMNQNGFSGRLLHGILKCENVV
ncbi:probable LRR receptor-like serine/threonine-protein kinase At2g24230 [Papaver somniferum]|uniref:probable LRR receptor-like serine/threonine-protein kinase At2g24230 n=1 Tax=Papaver somniferum TaxID=3469 RepID=UPI000E6F9BFC|nr:probable LRR receptor-like serine/threonine-protein kinase At2g24230 [Papaver somniferum]